MIGNGARFGQYFCPPDSYWMFDDDEEPLDPWEIEELRADQMEGFFDYLDDEQEEDQ